VTFLRGSTRGAGALPPHHHRETGEIEALAAIAKVVQNAGIPHIRVMAIDTPAFI